MLETDFLYRQNMLDQCTEAITSLENVNDEISKLQEKILAFVNDETLKSHRIAGAKAHFYDYYLLLKQLMEANELDKADFEALQTEISTNVTEDLCGDYLVPEQKRAYDDYLYHLNKADEYQELSKNPFLMILNLYLCAAFATISARHRQQATDCLNLANEFQQKIDLYDAVQSRTVSLFNGQSESIRTAIESGIAYMETVYNGGKFDVNFDVTWRPIVNNITVYQDLKYYWIWETPLNLEDNVGNKLVDKLIKIGITQEKVDSIWNACKIFYEQYGIELDPILLLSILGQEGNGSFNTSSNNPAADGQHGFEANFALDLMKANKLMFGKILGYMVYGDEFKIAVEQSQHLPGIEGYGSFAQYANWNTPIIDLSKGTTKCGVYAGHGEWYVGVTSFYESVRGENAMIEYSEYLSEIDEKKLDSLLNEVNLQDYDFASSQNSQNFDGKENGEYTIIAKKVL